MIFKGLLKKVKEDKIPKSTSNIVVNASDETAALYEKHHASKPVKDYNKHIIVECSSQTAALYENCFCKK